MKTEYWFQKWERNQIAFHEGEANSLLQAHFQRLALKAGARIFLPLCGKTRDIPWLLTKGHRVVGAELVEGAVERLFHELEIEPRVSEAGKLRRYQAANLDVFAGDIFELSGEVLGAVDAVYDRAALVALEPALRDRYAKHLIRITGAAPQLLIVYDYDQERLQGPPFSIDRDAVAGYYSGEYACTSLASVDVPGGLKGFCPARERLWLLTRKRPAPELP